MGLAVAGAAIAEAAAFVREEAQLLPAARQKDLRVLSQVLGERRGAGLRRAEHEEVGEQLGHTKGVFALRVYQPAAVP
jgi:hypothetical protein